MSSQNRVLLPLCLLSVAIIAGCSAGSSSSVDEGKMNIDTQSLGEGGCLNLQKLRAKFAGFPDGTIVRRITTSYEMSPVKPEDAIRRGFLSLNSFSNYIYSESASNRVIGGMAAVTQTGCESVKLSTDLEGAKTYKIVPAAAFADTPQPAPPLSLQLLSDDGVSMTWTLLGERDLEITTKSAVIDPCPEYTKAIATSTVHFSWGSEDDLAQKSSKISRAYLRTMSTAVVNMPDALLGLATQSQTDEQVTASGGDLQSLAKATLDSQIEQCPYRANPPSGDEPPSSGDNTPAHP
jgi:hypothetical protein